MQKTPSDRSIRRMSASENIQKEAARRNRDARFVDPRNMRFIFYVTSFSVCVAFLQVSLSAYAFFQTGSSSVLSRLLDSFMDVLTSVVTFISVRFAARAPDGGHRFGHEKVEPLAVIFQLMIIFWMTGYLVYYAGLSLLNPLPLSRLETGWVILVISLVINCLLLCGQHLVIRRTQSLLVRTDFLHYVSDFLVIPSVMAALFLSKRFPWIDGAVGIAIGLYIFKASVFLLKDAVNQLLDAELPRHQREKIVRIIEDNLKNIKALGYHWLRTRRSGEKLFIELHLIFPPSMTLIECHNLGDQMCVYLNREYPRAEIFIHTDPAGIEEYIPDYELGENTHRYVRPLKDSRAKN